MLHEVGGGRRRESASGCYIMVVVMRVLWYQKHGFKSWFCLLHTVYVCYFKHQIHM